MIGIGLGSAFGQAMQGDMNAMQMNRQQDESDRLGKQFEMLETNFNQQQKSLFKQGANEAILAAEGGDWSNFKTLAEDFPDQFGGGELVRAANTGDYTQLGPDGVSGIGGQVRNKFLADTGSELPEDPTEAMKVLEKSGMISGDDGATNSFVTADQLAKGVGSGFADFKKQKQLAENLMKAKITKEMGKASDEDTLAQMEAIGVDNLDPINKEKYKILNEKLGMTKAKATANITDGNYNDAVKNAKSGGVVNPEEMQKAKRDQILSGIEYKEQKDLTKNIVSYNNMNRLNNEIQKSLGDDIASGIVESKIADTTKRASDEEFKAMKKDDQIKAINKIMRDSKIGTFIADYLKDISGAAVTEEEYLRVLKIMTGGDLSQVNNLTLSAAFQAATEEKGKKAEQALKGVPSQYAGTILEGSHMLYGPEGGQMTSTTAEEMVTDGGTKSMGDVAAGVPIDQANQAYDMLRSFAKNLGIDLPGGNIDSKNPVTAENLEEQKFELLKTVVDGKQPNELTPNMTVEYITGLYKKNKTKAQEWITDNWVTFTKDQKDAIRANKGK